ncbi:hypothetical protein [Nannocystis punicea]|uniref:Transmembrane protein n=1 Tax=Nannocystis punicea TaxID=2995304 RepID=A0ABY7HB07_9BACT|nr:hypothetical protein [Nannocystis poenicansa]WAS96391.1 hypothetical protein O0S08_09545 [Nannocystis poenicansa]
MKASTEVDEPARPGMLGQDEITPIQTSPSPGLYGKEWLRQSENLPSFTIRDEMKPEHADQFIRFRQNEEMFSHTRTMIVAWEAQQKAERELRVKYAHHLLWLLSLEIAAVFLTFCALAAGLLTAERWMGQMFIVFAFAQSSGLVFVIVKYLFPHQRNNDLVRFTEISLGLQTRVLAHDPTVNRSTAEEVTQKAGFENGSSGSNERRL